jgi:hypothetical protein
MICKWNFSGKLVGRHKKKRMFLKRIVLKAEGVNNTLFWGVTPDSLV